MIIELLHTNTDGSKRIIRSEDIIKIGKDGKSNIVLSSGCRMHAVLERGSKDDEYLLIDLGSSPRTKVNDVEVNKSKIVVGDTIQIGVDILKVEHIGEKPSGKPVETKGLTQVADLADITKLPAPEQVAEIVAASCGSSGSFGTGDAHVTHVSFNEFSFTNPPKPEPEQKPEDIRSEHSILHVDWEEFDVVIEAIDRIAKCADDDHKEQATHNALYLWAALLNDSWVNQEIAYLSIEKCLRVGDCRKAIMMIKALRKGWPFRTFGAMWRQLFGAPQ